MNVSIIIVNYNTKQLLADCLTSIYAQTKDIEFEVIVSDNGSTDGSIEMLKVNFPQVVLIENNANLGFGAANNRGLAIAKGKYIFYLNSDTILLNNAVKIFFDYWERYGEEKNIGGLGCNLKDEKGNIVHSYNETPNGFYKCAADSISNLKYLCKSSYKTAVKHLILRRQLRKIPNEKGIYEKHIGEVGTIVGADLFLRNDSFAKFDERFFMYCEEDDLLLQITRTGKKLYLIEGPEILHLEGGSAEKIHYEVLDQAIFCNLNYLLSQIIFYKKNNLATKKELRTIKKLTFLFWLNPLLYSKTKPYIKRLVKEWHTTF